MYKRIEDLLDKYGFDLVDKKRFLIKRYTNNYIIKSEIRKEIELMSKKMLNVRMHELKKILCILTKKLNKLNCHSKSHYGKPLQENLDEIEFVKLQLELIEQTISNKQKYQKKYTHLVDRNMISHGFFSTSTPTKETLNNLKNQDGSIDYIRNGIKKLYYRNSNGVILTTYDTRVLIGLFRLWEMNGKNKLLTFDFKDLLKAVHRDLNGGEYKAIAKSIDNLVNTSVIMEEYSFPHRPKKRTSIFNPIQSVQNEYPKQNHATVIFHDFLQNSLLAGNYIRLSMGLFNDLILPTSKTLYINIIKMFSENVNMIEIETLIEHLGLHSNTRYKAFTNIKKACQELVEFDVLKSFDIEKKGRIPFKIHFFPSNWVQEMALKDNKRLFSIFKCEKHRYVI